jgi:hypothetical protein
VRFCFRDTSHGIAFTLLKYHLLYEMADAGGGAVGKHQIPKAVCALGYVTTP